LFSKRKRARNKYFSEKKVKKIISDQDRAAHAKVVLFFIPLIMIFVFAFGIYMGFYTYKRDNSPSAISEKMSAPAEYYVPDVSDPLLIIVSLSNTLTEAYVPELIDINGVKLSPLLQENLKKLLAAASDDKIVLKLEKGYISYDEQERAFLARKRSLIKERGYSDIRAEAEAKKLDPKAGESEAQTGLCVWFTTDDGEEEFEKTSASVWLERNCVRYGFILRYPKNHEEDTGMTYDPKLYRYVGKENALKIRAYGMCLEEYCNHVFF